MSLSALSTGLPSIGPPQTTQPWSPRQEEFPENLAGAMASASIAAGGSEFARPQGAWSSQSYRKPPQREGITVDMLASARVTSAKLNGQLECELRELKAVYVFRNESAITEFVLGHRAVAGVLLSAIPELKKYFGEDVVFNLEAVRDDDESTTLYAIVVWRGLAEIAVAALADFDENWWLNRPAQSGLTFTYELA